MPAETAPVEPASSPEFEELAALVRIKDPQEDAVTDALQKLGKDPAGVSPAYLFSYPTQTYLRYCT